MEFAPPPPPRGVLDISLGGEVRPGDGKTAWLIAEPVSLYKHTHLFFLSHGGQGLGLGLGVRVRVRFRVRVRG